MIPLLIGGAALAAVGGLAAWSGLTARRIERLVPAEGQFRDVPGARIHYVERGPRGAPPVAMIHGILAQLRNFSYALLDRLAVDHRVILIDRPGWGYSTLTGKRPGLREQAEMIATLLDDLGVARPVLVGHSLGGAVSLALAEAHPERVRGLALIAPFTQPMDQVPGPFRNFLVPAALRTPIAWTLALPSALLTAAAKTREVFAPDPVPTDFATRGGGALTVRPRGFEAGAFEMRNAGDEIVGIAARYPELRVPTAILYGREDNLLDPGLHGVRTASEIPGAELTQIEGGHMLPITKPAETEAWLRAAIARMPD